VDGGSEVDVEVEGGCVEGDSRVVVFGGSPVGVEKGCLSM